MSKYIKQLTNENLSTFLENVGYSLVTHLKDNDGNLLPAIERSEDSVFVRCQKCVIPEEQLIDKELAYYLMKSHPGFLSFARMLSGQFDSNIEMLIFYDFEVSKLCVFDDDLEEYIRLNKAYAKYMSNKNLEGSYTQDYHQWINEQAEEEMEQDL